MKTNNQNGDRFQDLVIAKALRPLLVLIISNKCRPEGSNLKDVLSFFSMVNYGSLRKNSVTICYEDIKEMYGSNLIPLNVFWISCININTDNAYINSHSFYEEITKVKETIINNNFELTHEWIFEHESYSGIFLYFSQLEPPNNFISIFIVHKNIDGDPTLVEIKNSIK